MMTNLKETKTQLALELANEELQETVRRQYDWVDGSSGFTWEKFTGNYLKYSLWFYTLMDLSAQDGMGWQQLALNLGLTTEDVKWCEQYHGISGPTSTVFTKLHQLQSNISLHHLLCHLISMGRHDILSRVPWRQCIEEMKRNQSETKHQRQSLQHTAGSIKQPIKSDPSNRPGKSSKTRPYGCSILLLYASDAQDFAEKVCRQLRSGAGLRQRIGVLLLAEQRHAMLQDPHTLLYRWFTQVDYIVPVLSPELLRHFSSYSLPPNSNNLESGGMSEEQWFVYHRYLYRLTLDQYVALASRNTRCRPICSASLSKQVCSTELVRTQGLLQVTTVCNDYNSVTDDTSDQSSSTGLASYDSSNARNSSVENFAHLLLKTSPKVC